MSNREQTFIDIISGRRRGISAAMIRGLLRVGEIPYSIGSAWKNRRFDRDPSLAGKAGVPVISIGNLTTGGTGKTPMVTWVCRQLRQQNLRVCIISRGYGAQRGSVNDEALELERQLPDVPHLQNPDRIAAARVAVDELGAQVIVLDDAFQHRRIHRDLDIVLIDAANPFGFDHQLPRGLLRESPRGLCRAQIALLTRADMITTEQSEQIRATVQHYNPDLIWCESVHQPASLIQSDGNQQSLTSLRGKRIAAFCGIGNPAGFRHSLESSGYRIVDFKPFPDHHAYSRETIQELVDWSQSLTDVDALICTHKDLVKIGVTRLGSLSLYALSVGLNVRAGEELLLSVLMEKSGLAKNGHRSP